MLNNTGQRNTLFSKVPSYMFLIGISIFSASIILAIPSIVSSQVGGPNAQGIATLALQFCLFFPLTIAVIFVYPPISRVFGLPEIHSFFRVVIPIMINATAASSTFVSMFFITPMQRDRYYRNLSQNVTMSIIDETIAPSLTGDDTPPYYYQVNLHVENNSGEEIPHMWFSLAAFNTEDSHERVIDPSNIFAAKYYDKTIKPGASDIMVRIALWEGDLYCSNEIFNKPLYLIYKTTGNDDKFIAISGSIHQQLLDISCPT